LNQLTARKIYEHRREHGPFRSREDLKNVSGFGSAAFTYSAGFLRIPDAGNPFDATRIHPESYELATHILGKLGFTPEDLRNNDKVQAITERIAAEKFREFSSELATELGAGIQTVRDILDELRHPGRDPREALPQPVFRKNVQKIEDLTPGTEISGTVLNIVNFGAFFDVGLHESGFVHISQMSTGFIRDAHDKLSIGETVKLWVVSIDTERKRLLCTMLPPGTEKLKPNEHHERPREDRGERPPRKPREETGQPLPNRSDSPRSDHPQTPRSEQDRFKVRRDDRRDNRRDDKPNPNREPRVFAATATKEAAKPISDKQKQGKEPLRSFGDLAQLFGRVDVPEAKNKDKNSK
jgi:transcriptional accessory protein Tex/SPT6